MRIKKLHIKNGYKRFHDLTIDLGEEPKRIIALVGPNGCGKSSVLDALMLHIRPYGRIGGTGQKDDSYYSMTSNKIIGHEDININFLNGEFIHVFNSRKRAGQERTIFSFRSPYRYNSNVKISDIKAIDDIKLNNYGASTCADLDRKMGQNYRRLNAFYRDKMEEENLRPSETKKIIIGELNESIGNCLDLQIAHLGNVEDDKGTLYFTKSDQPNPFEFNVLSSGEKEVVDIILDLFLRKQDYNDTVFLIDEPELHINTSIQKNLLLEINKLIGENCQIWICTHSIGFLRALQTDLRDECSIIEFENGVNYASEPKVLKPIQPSFRSWKKLFETPLDDLSQLICPKQIIYCEGRDEPAPNGQERGFDAQFYNKIFGAEYPDTLFVSSGGNTELDQRSAIATAILGKAIENLDILILKDRDSGSGTYMSETDRLTYLNNNENNHRMLKRLEIENYVFDKEVVMAYCATNEIEFDEGTYEQHIPDIKNDDIKDKVNVIKNICGITGGVNPNTFKLNLANYITTGMAVYEELKDCIFKNAR